MSSSSAGLAGCYANSSGSRRPRGASSLVDQGWRRCDIDGRKLRMARRADCGSVHLASTTKEQKADCGIWRQRWDLGGLICCSDMIRLERGEAGRAGWEDHTYTRINTHTHTHTHTGKDDGSDWKGFPLGILSCSFSAFLSLIFSCSLRDRYLPAHRHSISTSIWTTEHAHTLKNSMCVCERKLARYKRSAALKQSTASQ